MPHPIPTSPMSTPISPPSPQLVTDIGALRELIQSQRNAGRTVGLIPTMGALHAGHLSLVEAARRDCDYVVTSVFVNPTQFGPQEDLANYPRDLERDCQLLGQSGCDLVFAPSNDTMYPAGCDTFVEVGAATSEWEGEFRPTHFRGVATIVLKLFQIAPAHRAYFGRKDYQQTVVVQRMVEDLNVPIEICLCPIVRDAEGLALSSRNAYLTPAQRQQALSLSQSLQLAQQMWADGERQPATFRQALQQHMQQAGAEVQYVALLRPGTVQSVDRVDQPTVFAIAAQVGKTRLLDNALIG
jgi:pantoate--beta-alanine ligase